MKPTYKNAISWRTIQKRRENREARALIFTIAAGVALFFLILSSVMSP
jgi:hypothetical protein